MLRTGLCLLRAVRPRPARAARAASSQAPLAGVTVVDMTRVLAGPFCTMLLADLGADVIKIERPERGDDTRAWGPPFVGDQSCYFVSINRSKRSVAVNIATPEGQNIVRQLAKKADVLVENFLPGKMAALGLDYARLHALNDTLIYCSISGYGQTGPYAARPGYDVIAASLGGLLHITGDEDGPPAKVGVAMTDLATGLYAHGAIMAALLQRYRDGEGQHVLCDLLSSQVACLANLASNYLNGGQEARRLGTAHESIVPYQMFRTRDSHLTLGAGNSAQFTDLCVKLGLPRLLEDERFASNELRVRHRHELVPVLEARLAECTTAEWLRVLDGSAFPYGPVNNMEQVFSDPQVLHNGLVEEVDHPTAGRLRVVAPPVSYSKAENRVRAPPPLLGQHTDEVLRQFMALDDHRLAELRQRGVIQ
ncbi:succinate--hydroxymethylglutarate CoA-transferase-like isoform X2 [Pollicipes pollicipes]|nr:succinate--hydroxymethylglutarate CoA-transferase-like isoform X2 [Pollicipes pollicipes]XP_037082867.1 succinate--hydroxymethylglutarate CoA-transferase-like isoform X2 [Pollicipes pollicipes]